MLNLENKNIVVVGMGLTGLSCVRFLLSKGAKVVAMDSRESMTLDLDIPLYLGEFDISKLRHADLIVVSPGVSLQTVAIQSAIEAGVRVIGDIELFAQFNSLPVIAVTGSNGKSTVVQLVAEMCEAAGKKVLIGGNIGVPVLDLLDQQAELIVLELSSFQLETTTSLKPLVATVLNVCEDHLDRHGDLESYQQAKLSIYRHAQYRVNNRDDNLTLPLDGKVDLSFGLLPAAAGFSWYQSTATVLFNDRSFISSEQCLLVGAHNMLNIQAAAALAMFAGVDIDSIKQGAKSFGGLPHRCQSISMYNNVRWINDSKATNVGATLAAIKGLVVNCKGKLVLIAGGDGKGADFSPLEECLERFVALLITLGRDGNKIGKLKANSIAVNSLQEAVQVAAQHAKPEDMVLLSPACASLDMFANYQQRGECFVKAVQELAA